MSKDQAIKLAGGQAQLAKMLGITRGAVWQWKVIPQGRLFQLRLLRPEWFHAQD
jgi:hypothetical protein